MPKTRYKRVWKDEVIEGKDYPEKLVYVDNGKLKVEYPYLPAPFGYADSVRPAWHKKVYGGVS